MFNAPKVPTPPKPPTPPQMGQSQGSADAYTRMQKGGIGSTIITSSQGDLSPASTTRKSLLGQ